MFYGSGSEKSPQQKLEEECEKKAKRSFQKGKSKRKKRVKPKKRKK